MVLGSGLGQCEYILRAVTEVLEPVITNLLKQMSVVPLSLGINRNPPNISCPRMFLPFL